MVRSRLNFLFRTTARPDLQLSIMLWASSVLKEKVLVVHVVSSKSDPDLVHSDSRLMRLLVP